MKHEYDPDEWRVCKVCGAQGDILCQSKAVTDDEIIHRANIGEAMTHPAFDAVERMLAEFYSESWCNPFYSVDDLPLTHTQKEIVLEYLAWQLVKIEESVNRDTGRCGKTYDPLWIKGNVAHSYAFDLWDGGRHHEFTSLKQVEQSMINETVRLIKGERDGR